MTAMNIRNGLLAACSTFLLAGSALAQQVSLGDRTVFQAAQELKNGEFVWAPQLSSNGPALVVVNLATQRAVLFRNGIPVAASTISSGAKDTPTPTGVFTILQKNKEHYSSTYNNAPMPNMQRLTWKGIALHAGKLPGYPASHGCIRLPHKFSELLFGQTALGMTVVITSIAVLPRDSAAPGLATTVASSGQPTLTQAAYEWSPEKAPKGMTSVIVSTADQRALVFRNGVQIGSAPVRFRGRLDGGMAYILRAWDNSGQHWLKLQFSGAGGEAMDVSQAEKDQFDTPFAFRQAVAASLKLGSVIIVTPESLSAGSPGREQTVIDQDAS